MVDYHSSIGSVAYLDLLRIAQDDVISKILGTPRPKTISGKTYWYDYYRTGTAEHWKYIGPETPELKSKLAEISTLRAASDARKVERSRLVRLLRAEGFMSIEARFGSLLAAMERIGVFRLGGTLVGTTAFRLYEGELGTRLSAGDLVQTGDLDIASFEKLSLAIGDQVEQPMAEVLGELGFEPRPSVENGKVWNWSQATRETLVEFLTPGFGDEGLRTLPALGVSAQALHHLNFLIADPIKAVALYRSGVLVQIPRPEAFAIHKLIIADRRRRDVEGDLKSRKDRAQAAFLIEVLAEMRPDELAEAFTDAMSRGAKWRSRLQSSLKRMPESHAILEALPS